MSQQAQAPVPRANKTLPPQGGHPTQGKVPTSWSPQLTCVASWSAFHRRSPQLFHPEPPPAPLRGSCANTCTRPWPAGLGLERSPPPRCHLPIQMDRYGGRSQPCHTLVLRVQSWSSHCGLARIHHIPRLQVLAHIPTPALLRPSPPLASRFQMAIVGGDFPQRRSPRDRPAHRPPHHAGSGKPPERKTACTNARNDDAC
jgi:hypothetical protein